MKRETGKERRKSNMARFQGKQEEIAYRIEMEKFLFSVHCSQKWLQNSNNFRGAVGQYSLTRMFPKVTSYLRRIVSLSKEQEREEQRQTRREGF